jgi:hypothetical protein
MGWIITRHSNLDIQYGNNNKIFREQETPGVILGAKEIFDFVDSRYCTEDIDIMKYRYIIKL